MSNATNTTSTFFGIDVPPIPSPWAESDYDELDTSPGRQTITMILPVIIVFFFLVCFFTIYLFHDILRYLVQACLLNVDGGDLLTRREQGPEITTRGLNPTILCSFPVYPYSSIKKLRKRKCGLVCAVCLSEFSDDDDVRLLTVCNHAFHPDCIDPWLAANVTCPVCRCDLEKKPVDSHCISLQVEREEEENSHRISVKELTGGERTDGNGGKRVADIRQHEEEEEEEEEDDYTLRLPENAEERMVLHLRPVPVGKEDDLMPAVLSGS